MTPGPGGGPWSATAHSFVQHQLSHAVNFWRQGRPAVFHLQSRSDGQAVLNLTFQLPSPSEIIPPPSPYSTTPLPTSRRPVAPTPPPKRPIVPLFPPGEDPHFPPFPSLPTPLSSRQRKSYQRSAIHRAARAAPNPPPPPQAAPHPPPYYARWRRPAAGALCVLLSRSCTCWGLASRGRLRERRLKLVTEVCMSTVWAGSGCYFYVILGDSVG